MAQFPREECGGLGLENLLSRVVHPSHVVQRTEHSVNLTAAFGNQGLLRKYGQTGGELDEEPHGPQRREQFIPSHPSPRGRAL